MNNFDTLIIISFVFFIFLIFCFDLLYKRLKVCFEKIKDIEKFNEETFEVIQSLEVKNTEHGIITENIKQIKIT